jgi:hypothetical protein
MAATNISSIERAIQGLKLSSGGMANITKSRMENDFRVLSTI